MKALIALLLALVSMRRFAQAPPIFDPRISTMGSCPICSSDGRTWQDRKYQEVKIVYLDGISEALAFVGGLPQHGTYFPQSLDAKEFVKAIDQFYNQPENLPIPIMQAMRVITMRSAGADPITIETEIAALRKDAAAFPKRKQ